MEKQSSSSLAEWLDRLARESWQLELIISGFAIFLLIGTLEPLAELEKTIKTLDVSWRLQTFILPPYIIANAGVFILLINLCVHVVFRGLWISTVGLRSVSQEIDFEVLRLQPKFEEFLRRRVGSFDRYIERLEQICSVLFAFTFLILFMLLALMAVIMFTGVLNLAMREWLKLPDYGMTIVNFLLLAGALLYFADFVTLSWLKRIGWLRPVYYPFYRIFSLITLATLYRPLYYNLIDHPFGRRVSLLLIPYILFLMVASSATFISDAYFPTSAVTQTLETKYYDDDRADDEVWRRPSIPSRYCQNGFLELFIPYLPSLDDEAIKRLCPGLETTQPTGFTLSGIINVHVAKSNVNTDSIHLCMSQLHRIHLNDSLLVDPGFRFNTHPKTEDNGLLTVLDVGHLPRGEHLLRVEKQRVRKDTLAWVEVGEIVFWKE